MKMQEKSVLVTGGAKRIGAAIARKFAENGARLILHCRHSRREAELLADSLPGSGHRVLCADLSCPGAAAELFAAAGKVDVLVNNASLYRRTPVFEEGGEADRELFEVNFWSPLALMRRFAAQPGLTDGAVVNLLDQEIGNAAPEGGVYALSRRALADATLAMARELGPRGLRFNAVAPGPVLPPVGAVSDKMEKTLPTVPLRRPVAAADLAETVFFLAANDSATGEIFFLDGGQHLSLRGQP